jgi:hypothetical protein
MNARCALARRGLFHVKHIPIRLVITEFDPVIQVLPVAAFMDCGLARQ